MLSAYVYLQTLAMTLGERFEDRVRDERGQTAAEYLGVIVVVAAIIVLLANNDIGSKIKDAVLGQIDDISGARGGG